MMQLTVADTPPTPPEPLLAPGEGGEWSGPRAKVGEKSRSPGPNVFRVTPDVGHHGRCFPQDPDHRRCLANTNLPEQKEKLEERPRVVWGAAGWRRWRRGCRG